MADSTTTHRAYVKPEDGASEDTWGVKLNSDLDALDSDVYALLTAANYGVDSGAANAMVITTAPTFSVLVEGLKVRVRVSATNSGATTLNANTTGVKTVIANDGSQLTAGALISGGIYEFTYDGTAWKLGASIPAGAADTLAGTATGKVLTPAGFFGNASLSSEGYYKLPGGFTVQWGFKANSATEGALAVTFPVAFATACYGLQATINNASGSGTMNYEAQVVSLSTTGASVYVQADGGATGPGPAGFYWFAYGK